MLYIATEREDNSSLTVVVNVWMEKCQATGNTEVIRSCIKYASVITSIIGGHIMPTQCKHIGLIFSNRTFGIHMLKCAEV